MTLRVGAGLQKHSSRRFNALRGQNASLPMADAVSVNDAGPFEAVCLTGPGINQVQSASPAQPMPLTLLYANRRNLSKRVRVVIDGLAGAVTDYL